VLLKNIEGYVAEGPGFNVFGVSDGRLLTARSSALDGMTRRTVLEIAKDVGVTAEEIDLSLEVLQGADEGFLTTTAGGLLPIASVNGAPLGSAPGPVTAQLHGEYWGRRTSGWLSFPALYW
jgi:branched-chain amino acid aminotransferase